MINNTAVERCSNCGAQLDIRKIGGGVIECDFCHSKHVVARSANDAALGFLKIAEHELDTCKFSDAYDAYAKAAQADADEPQAYFGMALAAHKIQYIKDVVNNRLQPICHEIADRVFADDKNYKRALSLATPEQKKEYAAKAVEIDYIKKTFNSLQAQKLEYDCFICVKVTDDDGGHTEDSHIASTLYHRLKEAGYKPFYSEEEIRGRTGADYEALILYALWESESMIIVCNDESYLNTPWVKNEYTRFIKMLRDNEKESDSITFVFGEKPVERLPGVNGKIQGVPFKSFDALDRIIKFVKNHEPVNHGLNALERKKYADKKYTPKVSMRQTLQKRTLDSVEQKEISVSDRSRLNIAAEFLSRGDFTNAIRFGNELTASNKANGEAFRILFLAKNGCKSEEEFVKKNNIGADFSDFEKALAASNENIANKLYFALYSHAKKHCDYASYKEYIELPMSSDADIAELTELVYKNALKNKNERLFDLTLKTVSNTDRYIDMNLNFADALSDERSVNYFKNVLAADPSHCRAQWCVFVSEVGAKNVISYIANKSNQKTVEEKLFSYGFNKFAFEAIVDWAIDKCSDASMTCAALDFAFTMVPQDEELYYTTSIELVTEKLLKKGKIDAAAKYNEMLISVDPYAHAGYFNRCLIKRKLSNPLGLVKYADNLLDDPDYMSAVSSYTEKCPTEKNKYLDVRDSLLKLASDKDIIKNCDNLVKNQYIESDSLEYCKHDLDKAISNNKDKRISKLKKIGLIGGICASLPFILVMMMGFAGVSPFMEFAHCLFQFNRTAIIIISLLFFIFPLIGAVVYCIFTHGKYGEISLISTYLAVGVFAASVISSCVGVGFYIHAKSEKGNMYIGDGYVMKFEEVKSGGLSLVWCINSAENVIIPETFGGEAVVRIEQYDRRDGKREQGAFQGNEKMLNVTIPKTITYIGEASFAYCVNLVNFNYEGTMEEWNQVFRGGYGYFETPWNYKVGSYSVNCTDGTISN